MQERPCQKCGRMTVADFCEDCFLTEMVLISRESREQRLARVLICNRCGTPWPKDADGYLDDSVITMCVWGNCEEHYCHGCGRYQGGFGPVECPCDPERGHCTKSEAPKVPSPYRRSQGRRRHRRAAR